MTSSLEVAKTTHLIIPPLVHQLQINGLLSKLLLQGLGFTASIARHIGGLLGVWQGDQLHARVGLEDGPEALERCVDGAAERRGRDQVDLGVSGEGLAQFRALLVAEICEKGVGDDVVGGANVVNTLEEAIVRLYSGKSDRPYCPYLGGKR